MILFCLDRTFAKQRRKATYEKNQGMGSEDDNR